jgi:hypothetical protein
MLERAVLQRTANTSLNLFEHRQHGTLVTKPAAAASQIIMQQTPFGHNMAVPSAADAYASITKP